MNAQNAEVRRGKSFKFIFLILTTIWVAALIALPATPAITADFAEQQQLIDKAKLTIEAFGADPDLKTSLQADVKAPKGIFIVPQLLRGAFIFGGRGGSGILLVRDEKTGAWSQPVSYTPKQIPIAHSREVEDEAPFSHFGSERYAGCAMCSGGRVTRRQMENG